MCQVSFRCRNSQVNYLGGSVEMNKLDFTKSMHGHSFSLFHPRTKGKNGFSIQHQLLFHLFSCIIRLMWIEYIAILSYRPFRPSSTHPHSYSYQMRFIKSFIDFDYDCLKLVHTHRQPRSPTEMCLEWIENKATNWMVRII